MHWALPFMILAVLGASGSVADSLSDPAWAPPGRLCPPLDGEIRITGTFGEPRAGHLHTGLDLSTGGAVGLPVRAALSGSVVRLRAGARGYGRALYLEGETGDLVVYGHLSRFAPRLERYLREAQQRRGEFEIDLYPPAGHFRYAAGDTVGFSGQSGAGPPHLHMELRRDGLPRNPLLMGMVAADHAPPQLRALRLRALSPGSSVADGREWSWSQTEGGAAPDCTLRVWGWIGVDAALHDGCGLTTARLAPLEVSAAVNGEVLFRRRFEALEFSRGWEVNRIYGRPLSADRTWVQRLYQWPLEAGPVQGQMLGPGWIDATTWDPGPQRLELSATDAAGQRSSWALYLEARPPLIPSACVLSPRADPEGPAWVAGAGGDQAGGHRFDVELAEPFDAGRLPLEITPGGDWRSDLPCRIGLQEYGAGRFGGAGATAGWDRFLIRDRFGQALLAPLRLHAGPEPSSGWRVAGTHIDEGLALLELSCDRPPTGLPQGTLTTRTGDRVPLLLRGAEAEAGGAQIWRFAIPGNGARGQASGIEICVAGQVPEWIRFSGVVLPGRPAAGREESDGEPAGGVAPQGRVGGVSGGRRGTALPGTGPGIGPGTGPGEPPGTGPGEPPGSWEAELRVRSSCPPPVIACDWIAPGDSAWAALEGQLDSLHRAGELQIASAVLELEPAWWPMDRDLLLTFDPGAFLESGERPAAGWGLYRQGSTGSWRWLGAQRVGRQVGARSGSLGRFAILIDRLAPALENPRPRPGAVSAQPPAFLQVTVVETGSGFEPEAADILLDGTPLIAEYDIDDHWLRAEVAPGLSDGRHSWEVRVVDRAGNQVRRIYEFEIRRE